MRLLPVDHDLVDPTLLQALISRRNGRPRRGIWTLGVNGRRSSSDRSFERGLSARARNRCRSFVGTAIIGPQATTLTEAGFLLSDVGREALLQSRFLNDDGDRAADRLALCASGDLEAAGRGPFCDSFRLRGGSAVCLTIFGLTFRAILCWAGGTERSRDGGSPPVVVQKTVTSWAAAFWSASVFRRQASARHRTPAHQPRPPIGPVGAQASAQTLAGSSVSAVIRCAHLGLSGGTV